jgi:proteasome alpha subunit
MSMPFYVPPEQLTKDRADFARKGIARGRPIIVIEYAEGVLLMGENPSGSLHKTSEIYDRIGFAGVGRFNEFEMLRVAGIRYADLKGYSYERGDVTAKGLANAYAQTLGQIFTHEMKPYEIEVMIAEIGHDSGDTEIYRIQFEGTMQEVRSFGAMGGMEDELRQRLEAAYDGLPELGAAVRMAAETIEGVMESSVTPEDWEAAVLDRSLTRRRKFRRLEPTEIEELRSQ